MSDEAIASQKTTGRIHTSWQLQPIASGQPLVAFLVAGTLGLRSPIASWLSIGVLLSVAIFPVVLAGVRRRKGLKLLAVACLFASLYGLALAVWSLQQDPSRDVDRTRQIFDLGNMAGLLAMTIAALWCVQVLGVSKFLAAWAAGMIPLAIWGNSVFLNNPWKFGLALPVSILIILALGTRFRSSRGIAIVMIGLVSLWFGYRSWLVIAVVALSTIVVAGGSKVKSTGRLGLFLRGGILLACAVVLSDLALKLVLKGALGTSVQQRTALQLQWGDGNLILGARAEWGAALGLFGANPLGYGVGVKPSNSDWLIAIRSLYVPEGLQEVSNVSTYFRSGVIEFHSVLWNFWSHYGWAGLILWSFIALTIAFGFLSLLSGNSPRPTVLPQALLLLAVFWDLLFSPTVLPNIAAALAVSMFIISKNQDALHVPVSTD